MVRIEAMRSRRRAAPRNCLAPPLLGMALAMSSRAGRSNLGGRGRHQASGSRNCSNRLNCAEANAGSRAANGSNSLVASTTSGKLVLSRSARGRRLMAAGRSGVDSMGGTFADRKRTGTSNPVTVDDETLQNIGEALGIPEAEPGPPPSPPSPPPSAPSRRRSQRK